MTGMRGFNHPELMPGEIHMGNAGPDLYGLDEYTTWRRGMRSFWADNSEHVATDDNFPVFVAFWEFEQFNPDAAATFRETLPITVAVKVDPNWPPAIEIEACGLCKKKRVFPDQELHAGVSIVVCQTCGETHKHGHWTFEMLTAYKD